MCVICVSNKGISQPTKETLKAMFESNPHGAGYMVARNGEVEIHKGFMDFQEFWANVSSEKFTKDDVVVYHCRISTQAGVNREMCHPFPFTKDIKATKALDVACQIGIAHNGIIRRTTSNDREYSDTAHFIAEYMPHIIHKVTDIRDDVVCDILDSLIDNSKLAIMDATGYVATIGNWITDKDGLMYSNNSFRSYVYYRPGNWNKSIYK